MEIDPYNCKLGTALNHEINKLPINCNAREFSPNPGVELGTGDLAQISGSSPGWLPGWLDSSLEQEIWLRSLASALAGIAVLGEAQGVEAAHWRLHTELLLEGAARQPHLNARGADGALEDHAHDGHNRYVT